MKLDNLTGPHQSTARTVLRIGGVLCLLLGAILVLIGFGSFFASFATIGRGLSGGPIGESAMPRYFWCAFLGMPLIFVGGTMCMLGFGGAVLRFFSGETSPVAKDTFNYVADGVQPGLRSVGRSLAEGVAEGSRGDEPEGRDRPEPRE